MRVLTCIGDATCIDTWSNTPYFLLEAAKRAGFLQSGWRVDPERLRYHRMAWNLWRLLRYGERGGFQYSPYFLNHLYKQIDDDNPDTEVVSHFPLFPPRRPGSAPTSYYIDATLRQNFVDYALGARPNAGRRSVARALALEAEQYGAAKHIICMSRWAARSVVEDYGIEASKVHVVPGGANIQKDAIQAAAGIPVAALSPVRLCFVGKDWQRKRLNFVLEVADALRARGVGVEVVAIGFKPELGPRHPSLRAVGFIDKHSDMQRFIELIGSCHFSCLFSSAEAFGLSNRESLRLGVPVLAHDVGGIADTFPRDCGHLFERFPPAEQVADVVQSYVDDPDRYAELRAVIDGRRDEFGWDASVQKLMAVWSGSSTYSCARAPEASPAGQPRLAPAGASPAAFRVAHDR